MNVKVQSGATWTNQSFPLNAKATHGTCDGRQKLI